jgi:hypothetical protein
MFSLQRKFLLYAEKCDIHFFKMCSLKINTTEHDRNSGVKTSERLERGPPTPPCDCGMLFQFPV